MSRAGEGVWQLTSNLWMRLEVATSQRQGSQPEMQVTTQLLSREKTACVTGEPCDSTARQVPVARLQTRAVPSTLEVATVVSLGLMLTPVTLLVCPARCMTAR